MLFVWRIFKSNALDRSTCLEVSCKKGVFKIFANWQENICTRVSVLVKLQAGEHLFLKTLFFAEQLGMAASDWNEYCFNVMLLW